MTQSVEQLEKGKKFVKWGCLIPSLLLTVFIIYAVIASQNTEPLTAKYKPAYSIKNNYSFVIYNGDSLTYHNVTIEINDKYSYHLGGLFVKSILQIPLSEFVNSEGSRFNIFTEKVMNVDINVNNELTEAIPVDL